MVTGNASFMGTCRAANPSEFFGNSEISDDLPTVRMGISYSEFQKNFEQRPLFHPLMVPNGKTPFLTVSDT